MTKNKHEYTDVFVIQRQDVQEKLNNTETTIPVYLDETTPDAINLLKIDKAELDRSNLLHLKHDLFDAEIAIQGAQLLQFKAKDKPPLLFVSPQGYDETFSAIRGGVPLCFPWFGQHPLEKEAISHGFARRLDWDLNTIEKTDHYHRITFSLDSEENAQAHWKYPFRLIKTITLSHKIEIELEVINTGDQPFEFTFAFHTYFNIPHIKSAQVHGLEHAPFIDQLAGHKELHASEENAITFNKEVDRIYPLAMQNYTITDQDMPTIHIQTENCPSVVVWNPWIEKAKHLVDLPDEDWQSFVCVECGRLEDQAYTLNPQTSVEFKLYLSQQD